MHSSARTSFKRKREDANTSCDLPIAEGTEVEVEIPLISLLHAQTTEQTRISAACRRSMVDCPRASRTALNKFRASIDPVLARTLEIVGGYELRNGRTPLHEAAERGDIWTVHALLAAGADVRAKDREGIEPDQLVPDNRCSALFKHFAFVVAVLETNPATIVSAVAAYCAGKTSITTSELLPSLIPSQLTPPFLWAPQSGRAKIYEWARNAFIVQLAATTQPFTDLPDDCAGDILEYISMSVLRQDALHVLTNCSSPEAHAWVRAVLASALAELATSELGPAISLFVLEVVQGCLNRGADVDARTGRKKNTALLKASLEDRADVMPFLLDAGADIEARNTDGYTPLLIASKLRYTAVMKLLVKAGANIEARNKKGGCTALMNCSSVGHTAGVKLLIRAGAKVDVMDEVRRTALHRASSAGHAAAIKLLIEAGANIEALDALEEATPLIEAATGGYAAAVKALLEAGANKDVKNVHGDTLLIMASEGGHSAVVKLLLQAGADIEAKGGMNENTALFGAACFGNFAVVQHLIEAGANKHVTDENNRKASEYAREMGYNKVAKLLEQ